MKAIPHEWRTIDGAEVECKRCRLCQQPFPLTEFGKLVAAADGLQPACRECGNARSRRYNTGRRDKVRVMNARTRKRLGPGYWRERHQQIKRAMVAAYGGRCVCCQETEIEFLSLDHVDGGGRRHRAENGQKSLICRLRDLGWPNTIDGYRLRLLCMNCQFGFLHGRTCPHQLKREMGCSNPSQQE